MPTKVSGELFGPYRLEQATPDPANGPAIPGTKHNDYGTVIASATHHATYCAI